MRFYHIFTTNCNITAIIGENQAKNSELFLNRIWSDLSPASAHTTYIQTFKRYYLHEQLYDGPKREGATVFTEFDFSELRFSKNDSVQVLASHSKL